MMVGNPQVSRLVEGKSGTNEHRGVSLVLVALGTLLMLGAIGVAWVFQAGITPQGANPNLPTRSSLDILAVSLAVCVSGGMFVATGTSDALNRWGRVRQQSPAGEWFRVCGQFAVELLSIGGGLVMLGVVIETPTCLSSIPSGCTTPPTIEVIPQLVALTGTGLCLAAAALLFCGVCGWLAVSAARFGPPAPEQVTQEPGRPP